MKPYKFTALVFVLAALTLAACGKDASNESLALIEERIKPITDANIEVSSFSGSRPTVAVELSDDDRAAFGNVIYETLETAKECKDIKKADFSFRVMRDDGRKVWHFRHEGGSGKLGTIWDYRKDYYNPAETEYKTVDDLAADFPALKMYQNYRVMPDEYKAAYDAGEEIASKYPDISDEEFLIKLGEMLNVTPEEADKLYMTATGKYFYGNDFEG